MPSPAPRSEALAQAIAALEAQRPLLGDAVVDAALAPLRLQLAAHPTQRKSLVTVLALDVVGSTAISQQADPEVVHGVLDAALRAFSALIEAREGKVMQYAGDSLLAAFGVAAAKEDDAERAVLAGLDLLAEARAQAQRVNASFGIAGFAVRLGLHTGEVLLGGGVDDDGAIRGATVAVAGRLEQAAQPGSMLISQDTWRHVRGVFDVQPAAPLQVEGREDAFATYRVLAAKPRAFRAQARGIQGMATPLIGRQEELQALMQAFERSVAQRTPQGVTLLAEAGLGKSRLMAEFQHLVDAHPHSAWLLCGRAQAAGQHQPYGLLRDMLTWRLQIPEGGSAEAARQHWVQGLKPYFAQDDEDAALRQIELLGQLVGIDFSSSPRLSSLLREPRLLRNAALSALDHYLQRLTEQDGGCLVLLLDDLHWADAVSLDAFLHLLRNSAVPLLLVMGARPGLLEARPQWGEGLRSHHLLHLAPLSGANRQAIGQTLLARFEPPPLALLELIEQQAEGNPFYAEELVQMLIDDGVIDTATEPWQMQPTALEGARIPSTLVGVLQARLDALALAERRAAQWASVVGPVFWDDAVGALDASSPASLNALQDKAMVQPRSTSAFAHTRERVFHHHLLHQVTYDTLLKAERRAGHARAAHWLATHGVERQDEYLAVTAEHFARAGETAQALQWFDRASQAATQRYANAAALHYLERMLGLPELGNGMARWRVLRRQVSVADLIGDRALQALANQECLRLAEALNDDHARASTLSSMALLADRLGEQTLAFERATACVEVAERCDNAAAAALAHGELSWLARLRGEFARAHHHIDKALPHALRAAERQVEGSDAAIAVQLRLVAASLFESEDKPDAARRLVREAMELAQAKQLHRLQAACHGQLGVSAVGLAQGERALHHGAMQFSIAKEIGMPESMASGYLLQAQGHLLLGQAQAALEPLKNALDIYNRIGARYHAAECHLVQAQYARAMNGDNAAFVCRDRQRSKRPRLPGVERPQPMGIGRARGGAGSPGS
jgi:predicted ATPase/class 3 adenylate cyclase